MTRQWMMRRAVTARRVLPPGGRLFRPQKRRYKQGLRCSACRQSVTGPENPAPVGLLFFSGCWRGGRVAGEERMNRGKGHREPHEICEPRGQEGSVFWMQDFGCFARLRNSFFGAGK